MVDAEIESAPQHVERYLLASDGLLASVVETNMSTSLKKNDQLLMSLLVMLRGWKAIDAHANKTPNASRARELTPRGLIGYIS
ncbi:MULTISPECIES: hypothetical protein [unclassified Rhizobium]|uniref:hypothetical protein n=1 Tax=unclassified Rhizobium TaxID=2613769 RepID=UPI00117B30BD|nr:MULTISPECIES: hypothetical protein [unclassified Rhizobium]